MFCTETVAVHRQAQIPAPQVDNPEAYVVSRILMFWPGIAEAHNQAQIFVLLFTPFLFFL